MNRRRFLLTSLGVALTTEGTSLAVPRIADAQARGIPRIVILSLAAPPEHAHALEQGLRTLGYAPGTTIAIEHRSAEARAARLPALARDAVALQPRVIVAIGTTAAIAAQQATKDLPIVTVSGDIVAAGLVASLGRPEGNITGLSFLSTDLMLKRFDLLMELAPQIRRVAVVMQSPPHPTQTTGTIALRAAAQKRGVEVREVPLARVEDVKTTFAQLRESGIDGLLLWPSPILDGRAAEIGRLSAEARLITMLPWKEYARAGGLSAYAPDILALWRRAATYVDRILRGAKPAELPIEQPTNFELVINLKTAKTLGLTIPPSLLLRADQMIE